MSHKSDSDKSGSKKSLEEIKNENIELREQLTRYKSENNKLKKQLEKLNRENEALKESPNFVATVEEILNEEEIIIKKHGDNQVFLTEIASHTDVDVGDRVSINDRMSVTRVIQSQETDARAQAMEIESHPEISFSDIGGLEKEIKEVREAMEDPIVQKEKFNEVGIEPPSGALMYGPPGTGKTMLARAVANSAEATFIKLAGSELAQKFIGEGSRLVRDLFEVAKQNSPTIIFIDEIDAIAAERTQTRSEGGSEVQRTLMQLLSEMDGFDNRGDVRIMAATNRFDMLDEAILRPGRFDRVIEIPEPDEEAREQIFKIHTRDMNADELDYSELAEVSQGFTGADIKATCTEAGMMAIRDDRSKVRQEDIIGSIEKVIEDEQNPVKTRSFE